MPDRQISRRSFLIGAVGVASGTAIGVALDKNLFKSPSVQNAPNKEPAKNFEPVAFLFPDQKEITQDQFIQQFNLILDKSVELGGEPSTKTFDDGNKLERFVWYKDDKDNAIALSRYLLISQMGPNGMEKFDPPKHQLIVSVDQHQPEQLFENVTDVQTSFSAGFLDGSPPSFSTQKFDMSNEKPLFSDTPPFEPSTEDLWKLAKRITDAFNWSVLNDKTLRLA